MAEGILKSFDENLIVFSAGTKPASKVHPIAIKVLNEIGIDITKNTPKSVDRFLIDSFDYMITVCDNAKETCPVFLGDVKNRLHLGFEDPSDARGTKDEIIKEFRKIRDEIKEKFYALYQSELRD